jgi:hypothetical protein
MNLRDGLSVELPKKLHPSDAVYEFRGVRGLFTTVPQNAEPSRSTGRMFWGVVHVDFLRIRRLSRDQDQIGGLKFLHVLD